MFSPVNRAVNRAVSPSTSIVDASNMSTFAFGVMGQPAQPSVDTATYSRIFRTALARALPRKVWLDESNTINFLKAVPSKLASRVDVSLGCALSIAYLEFEATQADEMALTMKPTKPSVGSKAVNQPRYMEGLQWRGFASRWNDRAKEGEVRTPAKLDTDVNITLPRQWALFQPLERLDDMKRIVIAAHRDMDWKNALAPGLDGVRLFIVTTLIWAWNVRGHEERTQWSYLATDIVQVLRILVEQEKLRGVRDPTAATQQEGYTVVDGHKRSARKWKKSAKLRASESSR
ncbi:unnamed protein product [Peniophora sp. CBMAI 1063]|nr:unnamed protein product [Peniophora sp. CBMAI 1063]